MVDLLEPPFFNQEFQVTIDRRLIQGFHNFSATPKDFLDSQWPVLLPEDLLYRRSLGCFSLHHFLIIANLLPYCK